MTTQADGNLRLAVENKAYHRRETDGGSRSTRARGVVFAVMIVSLSGFVLIWSLMAAGMTVSVDVAHC